MKAGRPPNGLKGALPPNGLGLAISPRVSVLISDRFVRLFTLNPYEKRSKQAKQ